MQVCVEPATYEHAETNNLATNLTINTDEVEPIRFTSRTILQAPASQTTADAPVVAARLSSPSTSIEVFQPRPALAALLLAVNPSPSESNNIVDLIDLNDAVLDPSAFAADLHVPAMNIDTSTSASTSATSSTPRSVVINDVPEILEVIPSAFDLDSPLFQYYQDCRNHYERIKIESNEYQANIMRVLEHWLKPENFQMLGPVKQHILRMKAPELHLLLPDYDELDRLEMACEADRDAWEEAMLAVEEDDVEFDTDDEFGTDDYLTTFTDEVEPIGYEAEEVVDDEVTVLEMAGVPEEAFDEANREVGPIDVDGAEEEVAAIDAPIARNVVIRDSPETYDFVEIPSSRDTNSPDYQFYQNSSRDYQMAKDEGMAYRERVNKFRSSWRKRENIRMLSAENKRLVRLPKSEFILNFPEVADVNHFEMACEAEKAVWLDNQRMLVDDEDEFDSNDLDLTIHTNDVEPIGNEAEEVVDGEDEVVVEDECDSNDLDLTIHTNDVEPIGNEAEENVDVKDEGAVKRKRLRMLKVR
jgi:hypothetical protein